MTRRRIGGPRLHNTLNQAQGLNQQLYARNLGAYRQGGWGASMLPDAVPNYGRGVRDNFADSPEFISGFRTGAFVR